MYTLGRNICFAAIRTCGEQSSPEWITARKLEAPVWRFRVGPLPVALLAVRSLPPGGPHPLLVSSSARTLRDLHAFSQPCNHLCSNIFISTSAPFCACYFKVLNTTALDRTTRATRAPTHTLSLSLYSLREDATGHHCLRTRDAALEGRRGRRDLLWRFLERAAKGAL